MTSRDTIAHARWQIASAQRILHGLALVVALDATFVLGFAMIAPALGVAENDLFSGNLRALSTTALMGLCSVGGVVGVGLFAVGRVRPREIGWRAQHPWRALGAGLLGVVALAACVLVVMLAFGMKLAPMASAVVSFTGPQRLQMLLIGVIAALGEESVFRGYLQPALCARFGVAAGVLAGALVFAAYHLPVTPRLPSVLGKLAFGLVLGGLRQRTGSLWPPAIAHFGIWQLTGFA